MINLNEEFIGRDVAEVGRARKDVKLEKSKLHVYRQTLESERIKLVAHAVRKDARFLDCLCMGCGKVKSVRDANVRAGNETCGMCRSQKSAAVLRREAELRNPSEYLGLWQNKSEYEQYVNINKEYPSPILLTYSTPKIVELVENESIINEALKGYKMMTADDWKKIRDAGKKRRGGGEEDIPNTLQPKEVYERWEEQNRQCVYSGRLIGWDNSENHVTVDRIDSKGIYEKSNIQLTTPVVNQMKYTFSHELFLKTIEEIHAWQRNLEQFKYHCRQIV